MRENRLEKYRHWPEVTGLASGRARFKPGAQHLDRWGRGGARHKKSNSVKPMNHQL